MDKWTPGQISNLVGGLGTANCWKQYAKVILDEDLDGLTFQHISKESLIDLGFRPLHAEAIVKARDGMISHDKLQSSSSSSSASPPAYSGKIKSPLLCNAHQRPLEAYCIHDQQLVCLICMINHRGHHFEQTHDVFVREKARIEELVNEATQRSKKWLKAAEEIAAMRKIVQLSSDRVVAEMDSFFLAIEKRIRDRKEALRMELKRIVEEKFRVLTKQENELRTAVHGLERLSGSVKDCLLTTSAVECLQMRQELKLALGQEQGKASAVACRPQCDIDLKFVPTEKAVGDLIQGLGELHADLTVASKCEASGRGLETVIAGQIAEFTIVRKDDQGEVVKKGKDKFHIRVASGNTDRSVEIVNQCEGTFKCTYKVDETARESLAVSITLRETHIKGSPFTVKVRNRPRFLPEYCGRNLTLSQNNTVVRKSGGRARNGTILADGARSYRVKIISGDFTLVGFANNAINKESKNYDTCGYYLYTADGTLYSQTGVSRQPFFSGSCRQPGTVIECLWDSAKQEIWFGVDGEKPKLAFQNVPLDVRLYLALDFYDEGSVVELLE